ncbi:PAS domain S-box protein [Halorientalis salina]|uniref:PAS domain S-box protein n=1 Tax=Halorientalis salina TaxID=2932266 RepID=UPI0010AB8AF9|nr:PAS domain S-box protein [Halorientalis salina]
MTRSQTGKTKRRLPDGSHITVVTADGDRVPVEISVATVSLSDESVIYGIFRDISEQVEREREFKATTQRLQLALEGTNTGVWDWNIGTDNVRWTESLERLVGIEPGTFEGTFDAFAEYIHPADREKATATVEQAAETESRFQTEYRIQCKNGSQIWVESRGEIYDDGDDTKRMVGIVTDISERKERETEVTRKTEAMEKAPMGITLTDPSQSDNPLVYTNEHYCELTGYQESEILGRNCRFMQGLETDPEPVVEIRDAIDNEEPVSTVLRNYRKDGTVFWNHVTIAPIRDENGEVTNFVGFQEDVTDRIEREEQLELAETVFENTQDALFVVDVTDDDTFRVQRVNEVYEQLTGISNAEIAGKTPTEVVGDEIGGEIESHYRDCVKRRETIQYLEDIPVDGESRQWETKVTPIIEEGNVEKLIGAMRDVTEMQNV